VDRREVRGGRRGALAGVLTAQSRELHFELHDLERLADPVRSGPPTAANAGPPSRPAPGEPDGAAHRAQRSGNRPVTGAACVLEAQDLAYTRIDTLSASTGSPARHS
jgi:hypothetical protein